MSDDAKRGSIADLELSFAATLPKAEPGGYAKYADDNDPSVGVVFCRADGSRIAWMSTEAYFELSRKMAEEKR
jgi:hypothetical protein